MDIIFSKLKTLQKSKESSKKWNISWQLASFISNFTKIQQPKNILEVGTSNGFSTLAILRYLNNDKSKVTTIEVNIDRFNEARENFKYCGLKNITQIKGNALDVLLKIENRFDFIFLDAGQMYYKKLVEIIIEKNLIEMGGYIVADNIKTHDKMDEFIEFMNKNFSCELLEFDSGFLIAKKE